MDYRGEIDCKAAHSRQKTYVDNHRCDLEFMASNQVFLQISPMTNVMQFSKKGKLSQRNTGQFKIPDRRRNVTYHLALFTKLESIHPMFHISMLKKYIPDPSHVIKP